MKTSYIIAFIVGLSLVFASCGGSKSDVKVSTEMSNFMGMMKGSFKDVKSAVEKYGKTPEMADNDITMYDLKEPEVVDSEGDCYTMEAKAGATIRTYKICWNSGKIASIEDKGMR